MFDIESARKLLNTANVFFENDDDEPELSQTLNMNDVWAWGLAGGEYVPDEKLPEVAKLFWRYGWAGILYWASEQNDGMRSEFYDNNRFIEFVRNEERIKNQFPNSSERAYKEVKYTIG